MHLWEKLTKPQMKIDAAVTNTKKNRKLNRDKPLNSTYFSFIRQRQNAIFCVDQTTKLEKNIFTHHCH